MAKLIQHSWPVSVMTAGKADYDRKLLRRSRDQAKVGRNGISIPKVVQERLKVYGRIQIVHEE